MSVLLRRRLMILCSCMLFIGAATELRLWPAAVAANEVSGDEMVAGQDPESSAAAPAARPSAFMWLVRTSGWIGGGLLLISIYFVALVTQLFIELRADLVTPPSLTQEWETLLAKRD